MSANYIAVPPWGLGLKLWLSFLNKVNLSILYMQSLSIEENLVSAKMTKSAFLNFSLGVHLHCVYEGIVH